MALKSGTNQPDLLKGTQARDIMLAKGADDIVFGRGGRDDIFGGSGDDELFGHSGADRIEGDGGDDKVIGGAGQDRLFGEGGNDNLAGGRHADKLYGNFGHDRLAGNNGDDRLSGGAGDDRLFGGKDDDFLFGGRGADKARFSGKFADYDIDVVAAGLQVTHARGTMRDGTDILAGVEWLQFRDELVKVGSTGGGNGGNGGGGENDAPVLIAGNDQGLNLADLFQAEVDPSITIIDPDDTHMESATVAITDGFADGDQLIFSDQNGISGSYNGDTGVLTLTGHATKADYEAALESVEFRPGGALLGIAEVQLGEREFEFTVNDGQASSESTATSHALIDVELLVL